MPSRRPRPVAVYLGPGSGRSRGRVENDASMEASSFARRLLGSVHLRLKPAETSLQVLALFLRDERKNPFGTHPWGQGLVGWVAGILAGWYESPACLVLVVSRVWQMPAQLVHIAQNERNGRERPPPVLGPPFWTQLWYDGVEGYCCSYASTLLWPLVTSVRSDGGSANAMWQQLQQQHQ